jgi:hypothetical protein
MGDVPAELNWLADQQASRITHFSLHTAAAGSTGANEASGGSYARQVADWAAGGAVGPLGASLQPATPGIAWGSVTFPAAPAASYLEVGGWSAATAGTFRSSRPIVGGPYTHTSGSLPTWSVAVGPGVSS